MSRKMRGITLTDFKTYYVAAVVSTMWYQWRDRYINQWNKKENPEIVSYNYRQLIFDKGAKVIQCRKNNLFNRLF